MAKTSTIKLDGVDYKIHAFNLDELQDVMEVIATASSSDPKLPFKILRIALRRAEPKVEDAGLLEVSPDEMAPAVNAILALAGLQQGEANPPQQAPAAS